MRVRMLDLGILVLVILFYLCGCSGNQDVPSLIIKAKEGDNQASMKLVQAMGSPQKETALAAYSGVLDLGIEARPWLIKGLGSAEKTVVEASAAALGNLGDSGSVQALVEVLESGAPRRYAAAWALGEIGDMAALPSLVRALGDPDPLLRKTAVRALVKLGPDAGTAVTGFLAGARGDASQRAAIYAVGELRTEHAVPRLAAVDGANRDAAAWALGRIGTAEALEPLLDSLSDERWQVRREAAQALGNLEDERAIPALESALEDPEAVVREWAARSLETLTGSKVLYVGEDGELVPPYNLYR